MRSSLKKRIMRYGRRKSMPSRTQNYNLIKPAQDESYDIDQFNTNFDAIDAQLKANADAAAAAQGAADKHTHGNITNDGKIGTLANKAVYTGAGGALQAGTLPVAAGGTGGTTAAAARAGIGAAAASKAKTASLTVAGWDSSAKTQTVSVAGVTANSNIIVTPAPASYEAWGAAGIRATAQADGTVTFTCDTVPTEAITAQILIVG